MADDIDEYPTASQLNAWEREHEEKKRASSLAALQPQLEPGAFGDENQDPNVEHEIVGSQDCVNELRNIDAQAASEREADKLDAGGPAEAYGDDAEENVQQPRAKRQRTGLSAPNEADERWPGARETYFQAPHPLPAHSAPASTDFETVCGSFLQREAIELYVRRGVKKLYPWQATCLSYDDVVQGGRNFLYSLPTSGGKSLVSEVLLIKTCVQLGKKAMMILPYISIVSEKTQHLEEFGSALGFRVECFGGSNGSFPLAPGNQLIVATIEKANSVINHLIADEALDDLGLVVVDELHMLGEDPSRGYILELLLSKLRLLRCKWEAAGCPPPGPRAPRAEGEEPSEPLRIMRPPQVVGMSATLPNIDVVARWLDARLFVSDFRPVTLTEYIKKGPDLYDTHGRHVRRVEKAAPDDTDGLLALIIGLDDPNQSVLVFCATKKTCEKLAEKIARSLPPHYRHHREEERAAVVKELQNLGSIADPTLLATIPAGVAFHHAGITADERDLVEEAYRNRLICVLMATSTLAAGVNLPARRVILRSPYCGLEPLTTSRYKQMCGRAGRAGIDTEGESILIVPSSGSVKAAQEIADRLISQPQPPLQSSLAASCFGPPPGPSGPARAPSAPKFGQAGAPRPSIGFRRLLLEAVCTRLVDAVEDMSTLVRGTLFAAAGSEDRVDALLAEARSFLLDRKLIVVLAENNGRSCVRPTKLGSATFRSGMDPDDALIVHQQLQRAMECLILTDELQLCYLLTPVSGFFEPDWSLFYRMYRKLDSTRRRVADAMGVEEGYLAVKEMGRSASAELEARAGVAARRFFCALILDEMIKEEHPAAVATKYRVERGQVQALMSTASVFAATVVAFCKRMEYWALELVMGCYVKRLDKGVRHDLLPLVEIPMVKAARARALKRAGYRDAKMVANANPADLAARCAKALGPQADGIARIIVENAQRLMRRKSEDKAREAEECVAGFAPLPQPVGRGRR